MKFKRIKVRTPGGKKQGAFSLIIYAILIGIGAGIGYQIIDWAVKSFFGGA